jgi:hypothetical protein
VDIERSWVGIACVFPARSDARHGVGGDDIVAGLQQGDWTSGRAGQMRPVSVYLVYVIWATAESAPCQSTLLSKGVRHTATAPLLVPHGIDYRQIIDPRILNRDFLIIDPRILSRNFFCTMSMTWQA